jgi:hypothetical membrane protein
MKKFFMLSGVLAPIIYVATVILGGLLRPGYSHVAEAISELVATGAPNRPLLNYAIHPLQRIEPCLWVGTIPERQR